MKQEEKELLLKDLCARLPYGFTLYRESDDCIITINPNDISTFAHFLEYSESEDFKPYLRSMSSMTEEEHEEYKSLFELFGKIPVIKQNDKYFDFINSHHFDYRGLIPMGLAIEAHENFIELS